MRADPENETRGATSYKKEYDAQTEKLCRLGAKNTEIADFFGVCVTTIERWGRRHESFGLVLKVGKAEADNRVERSLFERATGYTCPDTHVSNYKGEITLTPIVKHHPPDTTACIFWLKNRMPREFRDRVELTGKDGGAIEVDAMSASERARALAHIMVSGKLEPKRDVIEHDTEQDQGVS